MNAVFWILCFQAVVGAFDNLWHHELQARLPQRVSARHELRLHALREAIYGALFMALAWFEWHGAFALVLSLLLAVELLITLADFVEEDRSRQLPEFERVLHTLLAVSYGVFVSAFAPVVWGWMQQPTGIQSMQYGWAGPLFSVFAIGVWLWSIRN